VKTEVDYNPIKMETKENCGNETEEQEIKTEVGLEGNSKMDASKGTVKNKAMTNSHGFFPVFLFLILM
jgi:hypothetical protein